MGKQGPCHHCGVTSTPLWRNGPPEKPVLCNACGSRWRTKGTLANYTPLHLRAEPDELEDYRVQRVRNIPTKNNEAKVLKRKTTHEVEVAGTVAPDYVFQKVGGDFSDYSQVYWKEFDEDTSNRSSSGSAISNSESCVQLGSAGASDLTGPAQSIVWDTTVPSRKRTCVGRPKPSSVEKLTKDLHTILQAQQSYFSGSSEEDLLFESDTPMVSVEIGHGSVLIRHPSSIAREEESEASSLSVDKKPHCANEAYSPVTALPVRSFDKSVNVSFPGIVRTKKPGQKLVQDKRPQQEKLHILGNHNSQLCSIDLKDVLNFEEFVRHITNDELQSLLKYLPAIDTVELPHSLLRMFDSAQFKEDLTAFQKLLADGVFNLSSSGDKSESNKTLKRLALCNLKTSNWVEQYNMQKGISCRSTIGASQVVRGHAAFAPAPSVKVKRSCDNQFPNLPGAKSTMKIPKRVMMTKNCEQKELKDNDFSPRNLFALPPDSDTLTLDSMRFADESCDQDLLVNIPSQSSFPQAELLPTSSFGAQASTSSSSIYENMRP